MSEPNTIQAAFRGVLGRFSLDASFGVPATGVTALFRPFCMRQDDGAALYRGAAASARRLLCH